MGRSCLLCRKLQKETAASFHQFPEDPERRQQWFKNIGFPSVTTKSIFLCSDHFTPTSIYVQPEGRSVLKKNALPIPVDTTEKADAVDNLATEPEDVKESPILENLLSPSSESERNVAVLTRFVGPVLLNVPMLNNGGNVTIINSQLFEELFSNGNNDTPNPVPNSSTQDEETGNEINISLIKQQVSSKIQQDTDTQSVVETDTPIQWNLPYAGQEYRDYKPMYRVMKHKLMLANEKLKNLQRKVRRERLRTEKVLRSLRQMKKGKIRLMLKSDEGVEELMKDIKPRKVLIFT